MKALKKAIQKLISVIGLAIGLEHIIVALIQAAVWVLTPYLTEKNQTKKAKRLSQLVYFACSTLLSIYADETNTKTDNTAIEAAKSLCKSLGDAENYPMPQIPPI